MSLLFRWFEASMPDSIRARFAKAENVLRLSEEDISGARQRLERLLKENVISFWMVEAVDRNGGYRLHHDFYGCWKGPTNKSLVAQCRTVWFFARAADKDGRRGDVQALAQHGFRFMKEAFLDQDFGGFYWEVDTEGRVTKPNKHLYGQAFALLALSEYAIVFSDKHARGLADGLFALLQQYAHDKVHGGYREQLHRSWNLCDLDEPSYLDGDPCFMKHMNTHLHLLEAITAYCRLTLNPEAVEVLQELILVQSNTVIQKNANTQRNLFARDWTPLLLPENRRISYGHDLENIRMLMEACRVVPLPESLLAGLFRGSFAYVTRYGFDRDLGGVFDRGLPNRRADRRTKIWWVQSEALSTSLEMYRLTRGATAWCRFLQVLNWVEKHQADWKNGDWHQKINADGQPSGDKAGAWKTPYHNGGALLYCLQLLDSLESSN